MVGKRPVLPPGKARSAKAPARAPRSSNIAAARKATSSRDAHALLAAGAKNADRIAELKRQKKAIIAAYRSDGAGSSKAGKGKGGKGKGKGKSAAASAGNRARGVFKRPTANRLRAIDEKIRRLEAGQPARQRPRKTFCFPLRTLFQRNLSKQNAGSHYYVSIWNFY